MALVMIMRLLFVGVVGVILIGWIVRGIIADDKFDTINYYEFMANQWHGTPKEKFYRDKIRDIEN